MMTIPTVLDPYFLFYTDGVSLYFASTSILFAILSDRGMSRRVLLVRDALWICSSQCSIISLCSAVQTNKHRSCSAESCSHSAASSGALYGCES